MFFYNRDLCRAKFLEVAHVHVESSQVSFYAACFHMQGGKSFLSDPSDPQRCGRYPSPDSDSVPSSSVQKDVPLADASVDAATVAATFRSHCSQGWSRKVRGLGGQGPELW